VQTWIGGVLGPFSFFLFLRLTGQCFFRNWVEMIWTGNQTFVFWLLAFLIFILNEGTILIIWSFKYLIYTRYSSLTILSLLNILSFYCILCFFDKNIFRLVSKKWWKTAQFYYISLYRRNLCFKINFLILFFSTYFFLKSFYKNNKIKTLVSCKSSWTPFWLCQKNIDRCL